MRQSGGDGLGAFVTDVVACKGGGRVGAWLRGVGGRWCGRCAPHKSSFARLGQCGRTAATALTPSSLVQAGARRCVHVHSSARFGQCGNAATNVAIATWSNTLTLVKSEGRAWAELRWRRGGGEGRTNAQTNHVGLDGGDKVVASPGNVLFHTFPARGMAVGARPSPPPQPLELLIPARPAVNFFTYCGLRGPPPSPTAYEALPLHFLFEMRIAECTLHVKKIGLSS